MKRILQITMAVVVLAAMLAGGILRGSAEAASHFRLAADAGWVDSGTDVTAGQSMTITAYGQAVTAPVNQFGVGAVSGPDGQAYICPDFPDAPPCAMDYAPYGALVGKIGAEGAPFLIGSSYSLTASVSGDLYLAVNDLLPYYNDNHGNYMVLFGE